MRWVEIGSKRLADEVVTCGKAKQDEEQQDPAVLLSVCQSVRTQLVFFFFGHPKPNSHGRTDANQSDDTENDRKVMLDCKSVRSDDVPSPSPEHLGVKCLYLMLKG